MCRLASCQPPFYSPVWLPVARSWESKYPAQLLLLFGMLELLDAGWGATRMLVRMVLSELIEEIGIKR